MTAELQREQFKPGTIVAWEISNTTNEIREALKRRIGRTGPFLVIGTDEKVRETSDETSRTFTYLYLAKIVQGRSEGCPKDCLRKCPEDCLLAYAELQDEEPHWIPNWQLGRNQDIRLTPINADYFRKISTLSLP